MNSTTLRRVERVRHELKRRDLTVKAVDQPTPHFRRITLTGDSLSDFVSAAFDDHLKVSPATPAATTRRAASTTRRASW